MRREQGQLDIQPVLVLSALQAQDRLAGRPAAPTPFGPGLGDPPARSELRARVGNATRLQGRFVRMVGRHVARVLQVTQQEGGHAVATRPVVVRLVLEQVRGVREGLVHVDARRAHLGRNLAGRLAVLRGRRQPLVGVGRGAHVRAREQDGCHPVRTRHPHELLEVPAVLGHAHPRAEVGRTSVVEQGPEPVGDRGGEARPVQPAQPCGPARVLRVRAAHAVRVVGPEAEQDHRRPQRQHLLNTPQALEGCPAEAARVQHPHGPGGRVAIQQDLQVGGPILPGAECPNGVRVADGDDQQLARPARAEAAEALRVHLGPPRGVGAPEELGVEDREGIGLDMERAEVRRPSAGHEDDG